MKRLDGVVAEIIDNVYSILMYKFNINIIRGIQTNIRDIILLEGSFKRSNYADD